MTETTDLLRDSNDRDHWPVAWQRWPERRQQLWQRYYQPQCGPDCRTARSWGRRKTSCGLGSWTLRSTQCCPVTHEPLQWPGWTTPLWWGVCQRGCARRLCCELLSSLWKEKSISLSFSVACKYCIFDGQSFSHHAQKLQFLDGPYGQQAQHIT